MFRPKEKETDLTDLEALPLLPREEERRTCRQKYCTGRNGLILFLTGLVLANKDVTHDER